MLDQFLLASLDSKVGLCESDLIFQGVAILSDKIAGISGQGFRLQH
jgi:hypothetical protein